MSSEDISLVAIHPFIRKFVYSVIQNIRAKNFSYEEKSVIHADLVPKVSEKVMKASMASNFVPSLEVMSPPAARPVVPQRRVMPMHVMPRPRPPVARPVPIQQPQAAPIPVQPAIQLPKAPQGAGLSQDYGRITPLLHDDSVSTIECSGVGKPVMVIRAGQKQVTNINLTAEEIKKILVAVSDAVHIPLLEGVFRAAVDNFSINAVISEMIGSKFVIKKQNAYAMLEQRGM